MKVLKAAPLGVVLHVKKYLERELPEYTLISVIRKHAETAPDNDNNLYFVIAKRKSPSCGGLFSCWTCWNELTRGLHYGHYEITLGECIELALEQCDNATDVKTKSGVFIKSEKDLIELHNYLDYSFVVSRVNFDNSSINNYTLDNGLLVLAVKDWEERNDH